MDYHEEQHPVVEAKGYAIYELVPPVGGRTHTMWGPDDNGKFCRCAVFRSLKDALHSFELMTGEKGVPDDSVAGT